MHLDKVSMVDPYYSGVLTFLARKFRTVSVAFLVICLSCACGPLPRLGVFHADLGILPISSEVTGLVMASVDPSYSSTDLYFYNLASGHLDLMLGGESGDVLARWNGQKLWIFNRSIGRVSYSAMSPKVGAASRQLERRTPGSGANDPADVLWVDNDRAILAMHASNHVLFADLATGHAEAKLDSVDTQDSSVPLRPGLLSFFGRNLAVFHQSLNTGWQAAGGGFVYFAQPERSGTFVWSDQNVLVPGVQGVRLNVSNPVRTLNCERDALHCLVAGSCFETMGDQCTGGVDLVDWERKSVTSQLYWPAGSYAAGQVDQGFSSTQVLSCLKLPGDANARLILFDISAKSTLATWAVTAPWCGPFVVDRAGQRVFLVQKLESQSWLIEFDASLTEKSRKRLGFDVVALESIDE